MTNRASIGILKRESESASMQWFKRWGKLRLEEYSRRWEFDEETWREWLDRNADLAWILIILTLAGIGAVHVIFN